MLNNVLVGVNDLGTTHPDLVKEWHPTKNGDLTPDKVTAGSKQKVWWLREKCGHEWAGILCNRAGAQKSGCSVCAGKTIVPGVNDLASKYPTLASQWHPTRNGELTPQTIGPKSDKVVWWLHMECGHEWDARIADRSKENKAGELLGCPICSGKRTIAGFNDLAFQNASLAAEWHPTKNGELTAEQVTVNSNKRVWWQCAEKHEWEAKVLTRNTGGNNCPYCANKKVWSGYNDLASVQPDLAAEWHPIKNGELTAQKLTIGSGKRVWWLGGCGHEWSAPVSERSTGHGCAVCHGIKIMVGINDLAAVNPILAAEWHPTKNRELTAEQVTAGSKKQVWWSADCGHEWASAVKSRSKGQGCRHCSNNVSKAEKDIQEFLISLGVIVESSNRKILKRKELDLWIPKNQVAIEFNGIHWHKEKYHKKDAHYDKWLACKDLGIQLIQIWEDDWNSHSETLKKSLAHALGIVSMDKFSQTEIKVVSITEKQVEEFMAANSIDIFTSGSYYLGLVAVETGTLEAVMVLKDEETSNDRTLKILHYITKNTVLDALGMLLTYATEIYSPDSFVAVIDNTTIEDRLYENVGFAADKVLPPDYKYVVGKYRKDKDSLTPDELASITDLDRIWDAGKTRYRLLL